MLSWWFIDVIIVFFFFKQKTAYEMRISDWSSDVCSSDLHEWLLGGSGECGRRRLLWKSGLHRSLAEHVPCNDHTHDLVGAFQNGMDPQVAPEAFDWIILKIAIASMKLKRRSEEHTSELQSLMRISYAVFCLKNKKYKLKHEKL